MRRFVITLLIVGVLLAPLAASAGSTSSLVTRTQVGRGFLPTALTAADTQYCPLTAFKKSAGVRQVAYTNDRDPLSVVAERLQRSTASTALYAKNLAVIARCHHVSRTVDGTAISERLTRVSLGSYAFASRAYVATVSGDGFVITGALFYAAKGDYAVTLAEVTNGPFSRTRFHALVTAALGRLAS